MRVVAIIQARMLSKRLPGKVLLPLRGKSVLERVLARVGRIQGLEDIAIATSDRSEDDAIAREGAGLAVTVVRGSEEDVLDRFVEAACQTRAEAVVRITADCPLVDPQVSSETVQLFLDRGVDYASNVDPRTYPRGLDTEVFTRASLEAAHRSAAAPYERAHVTPYIREHPRRFSRCSLMHSTDLSGHRWTLDTPDDWELIRRLYERLPSPDQFTWLDALALVEADPELAELNRHVAQKALEED